MAKRARNSRQDAHSSLEQLRNDITTAVKIYSSLSSKSFLYVYGDRFFELAFPKRCFRHLCGVDSAYTAERFYNDAKNGHLDRAQIAFDRQKGQSIRIWWMNPFGQNNNSRESLISIVKSAIFLLEEFSHE